MFTQICELHTAAEAHQNQQRGGKGNKRAWAAQVPSSPAILACAVLISCSITSLLLACAAQQ